MSFLSNLLGPKKTEIDPRDIIGPCLVGLIESALADGVLTRRERELLMAFAMDENVDLNTFNKYLTEQVEARGIQQIEGEHDDNVIIDLEAIKNFNQLIGKKVELAASDGKITSEEKFEILQEAQKLGLNLGDVEALINNVVRKKEPSPNEKFGPLAVDMVNMALADGKLTKGEMTLLLNLAKENSIDTKEFGDYIEMECIRRGVERVNDVDIVKGIENGDNNGNSRFRMMMEMAISDGDVSKEERDLLVKEGAIIGFSEEDVDLMIKTILAPQIPPAPRLKVVKPSDLQHTKKLLKVENLPDGRVEEYWEYIDEELVPNDRPDAAPGTKLLIKKRKVIKKTYKPGAVANPSSPVIDFIVTLDYDLIESAVSVVSIFFSPASLVLTPLVGALKSASYRYKTADPKNREQLFMIEIGKVSFVAGLPFVKSYIKNGDRIADALSQLITNDK